MATLADEPRPVIKPLAPLYAWSQQNEIPWLIVRLTAGGFLLIHGLAKLTGPAMSVWAQNVLTRRGIEPAMFFAYIVWFLETVGAVCLILGLFTRPFAFAVGIQFIVIVFFAHWSSGFGWNRPGGGYEYPLFWGLIILAIGLRGGGPWSLDRKLGWEL